MAAVIAGAGTAVLRINGTQYQARGNVTIMPLSQEVTAGRNIDGTMYYTVKPVPSTLEVDVQDSGGLSVQSFQGFVNEYITVELLSGKVFGFSNALFTGSASLDVAEGKFKASFAGDCLELTASS